MVKRIPDCSFKGAVLPHYNPTDTWIVSFLQSFCLESKTVPRGIIQRFRDFPSLAHPLHLNFRFSDRQPPAISYQWVMSFSHLAR